VKVALTGKQKAAMLLASLDVGTAVELLKGVEPAVVQELAVELAYLDAAGFNSKDGLELARQFVNRLQARDEIHLKSFLKGMLKGTVGDDGAKRIQTQIQDLLQKRDPFISVRSADSQTIASILENEHPQAVAVVLSEMPARKSSEVLGLLGEGVRLSAVSRMTGSEAVAAEAKVRIAEMICKRLETVASSRGVGVLQARPKQSLRKVAVILRNLGKELRDGLLGTIREKTGETGEMVANLMIVWEDIPQVADRSLQEALRGVDAKNLALALVRADEPIVQKIRSNISERAAAALDEEASLVSVAKKKDIEEAREEIVQVLRQMDKN